MGSKRTLHCYTDGSYNPQKGITFSYAAYDSRNRVTCMEAVHLAPSDVPQLCRLGNVAGEILAVLRALEMACQAGVRRVVVYHDFEGVQLYLGGNSNPLLQHYAERVRALLRHVRVRFRQIRGHAGIRGNVWADRLCRQAYAMHPNARDTQWALAVLA